VQDPELQGHRHPEHVKDVRIDGSSVFVQHRAHYAPLAPLKERIEKDVTAALRGAGAEQVKVELSANTRARPRPAQGCPAAGEECRSGWRGQGWGGENQTVAVNLAIGFAVPAPRWD